MRRRVQVPVVQARAIPTPAGVQDVVAYRVLAALREAVLFMQSEMNPKGIPEVKEAASTGTKFDEDALLEKVRLMIEEALSKIRFPAQTKELPIAGDKDQGLHKNSNTAFDVIWDWDRLH